ncbi:MAG TPA: thermonuclease family protein [Pyrinomonadaceae bacterium]|nr:thermonuclease family protein [Pyrinomonadaceae bacterium]
MSYEYPTRVTRKWKFQRRALLGAGIAVVFVVVVAAVLNAFTSAVREPDPEESSKTVRPVFSSPTPSADTDADVPVKGTFSARVTDVESGDTLTVTDVAGKKFRIQLTGVSAPIAGQKFSNESRTNLSKLSLNKPVTVIVQRTELSGSVSARVVQNGIDLGLEQLKQGFALLDRVEAAVQTDDVRTTYTAAEEAARRSGTGFWSDPAVTSTAAMTQPVTQPPASDVARFAAPLPPGQVAADPADAAVVQPSKEIPASPKQIEASEPPTVKPPTSLEPPASSKPAAVTTAPPIQEAKAAVVEKPAADPTAVQEALAGKKYIQGPRGGCYYLADSGKKVYVAHERCQ